MGCPLARLRGRLAGGLPPRPEVYPGGRGALERPRGLDAFALLTGAPLAGEARRGLKELLFGFALFLLLVFQQDGFSREFSREYMFQWIAAMAEYGQLEYVCGHMFGRWCTDSRPEPGQNVSRSIWPADISWALDTLRKMDPVTLYSVAAPGPRVLLAAILL